MYCYFSRFYPYHLVYFVIPRRSIRGCDRRSVCHSRSKSLNPRFIYQKSCATLHVIFHSFIHLKIVSLKEKDRSSTPDQRCHYLALFKVLSRFSVDFIFSIDLIDFFACRVLSAKCCLQTGKPNWTN